VDTVCKIIEVISPDVLLPNVVTPNGDGRNDLLKFEYLQFFPGNSLEIYNRWGALIHSKSGYANDWSPSELSHGTYYFVLNVKDLSKVYSGFFEVLK
jgi:gliding motility-associated-like protein